MAVTDSLTGKQVFRVAIGRGPDAAAFDSELGFVFSSNGIDGTLTVIHQDTPDQYRVIATVQTQKSAQRSKRSQNAFANSGTPRRPPPENGNVRPIC